MLNAILHSAQFSLGIKRSKFGQPINYPKTFNRGAQDVAQLEYLHLLHLLHQPEMLKEEKHVRLLNRATRISPASARTAMRGLPIAMGDGFR